MVAFEFSSSNLCVLRGGDTCSREREERECVQVCECMCTGVYECVHRYMCVRVCVCMCVFVGECG